MTFVKGLVEEREGAVSVWRAAKVARLQTPSVERVVRVREKLADTRACLVVGREGANGDVLAMALAEPGRGERGAGPVVPGYGHVSMVFVHPYMWGRGVGGGLLQALHERMSARGWNRMTLWTRVSNERGRRLYEGQGYHASGQEATLGDGDLVLQLERHEGPSSRVYENGSR